MKNYTKRIFDTKTEWKESRGIGGSDAAAICGQSKWANANDVYNRFMRKITEGKTTPTMEKGTSAEPLIRGLFQLDHSEYRVIAPPRKKHWMFERNDEPLITVTPDGLFFDPDGKYFGLEIKYCDLIKRETIAEWENNSLPNQYYFQCLQYLLVMDDLDGVCLRAYLKHYTFDDETHKPVFDYAEVREYWVFRKDVTEHLAYLEKKEKDFIHNNLEKNIRPQIQIRI